MGTLVISYSLKCQLGAITDIQSINRLGKVKIRAGHVRALAFSESSLSGLLKQTFADS